MPKTVALKDLTPFDNDNFDLLVDTHFPDDSWYSSDSLIEQYPNEQDMYADIFTVFGSEEFEKKYGSDPIGCIYVTHDDRVFFASYL